MLTEPGLDEVIREAARLSDVAFTVRASGSGVDLLARTKHGPSWAFPLYYQIAQAVQFAARKMGVPVVWLGAKREPLNNMGNPAIEAAIYVSKCRSAGIDPHINNQRFQLEV